MLLEILVQVVCIQNLGYISHHFVLVYIGFEYSFDSHTLLLRYGLQGGGGCLVQEKIVAFNSAKFVLIADGSKESSALGKCSSFVPALQQYIGALPSHHVQSIHCCSF